MGRRETMTCEYGGMQSSTALSTALQNGIRIRSVLRLILGMSATVWQRYTSSFQRQVAWTAGRATKASRHVVEEIVAPWLPTHS